MATGSSSLPRGGMWEKQVVYGGARLRETFGAGELFVLWGISSAGEVQVDRGNEGPKAVPKTNLEVSKLDSPDDRFDVGTLSSAIADMVPAATASDFPVVAFWTEVETEQGLNPATVLEAKEPYSPAS